MPSYELTIQVTADNEDDARAIAIERLHRNDGFELEQTTQS